MPQMFGNLSIRPRMVGLLAVPVAAVALLGATVAATGWGERSRAADDRRLAALAGRALTAYRAGAAALGSTGDRPSTGPSPWPPSAWTGWPCSGPRSIGAWPPPTRSRPTTTGWWPACS
jgi:hypothetical protein